MLFLRVARQLDAVNLRRKSCQDQIMCVVALVDQWYITNGEPEWKEKADDCLANMKLYSDETRHGFEHTLGWLNQWACYIFWAWYSIFHGMNNSLWNHFLIPLSTWHTIQLLICCKMGICMVLISLQLCQSR